jgi:hypothetical protein
MLCLFSHFMGRLFLILCGFSLIGVVRLQAQIPSTGFLSDPLSPVANRLSSRKTFAHQHVQPFCVFLDTAIAVLPSDTPSVCLGFYGDLAAGGQISSRPIGLGEGMAGVQMSLQGHRRWAFVGGYSHQLSALPDALTAVSRPYEVLWGLGSAKQKGDFYHGSFFYGLGTVRLGKYFELSAGRQKQHYGDGYRSLILSQQAAPLPFVRLSAQVHKVRFFANWMRAAHPYVVSNDKAPRHKLLALHGLSLNIGKRFNFTAYEMVVWQERDTLNRRGLELNYLNPIVFYRPQEFAQGSADNVILAATIRYKFAPRWQLYAQILLDEFKLNQLKRELNWWANKYGGQLGFKWFDALPHLDVMMEGNVVRPFTYTHGSPVQNWTHWSQPLAHPWGANFTEVLCRFAYQKNRWTARMQWQYGAYGRDRDLDGDGYAENLGGDINRSYKNPFAQYGNVLLQGEKYNVIGQAIEIAWTVDQAKTWEMYLQQSYRYSVSQAITSEYSTWLVGFRAVGLMSAIRDI